MSYEEEYSKIISTYPEARMLDNYIYHLEIPLKANIFLEIDYKKYPKRPKVKLRKSNGESFKNLERMISTLNNWKSKNPPSIVELINDLVVFIHSFESQEILIKNQLVEGIFGICRTLHPREILGLLRVNNGIVIEYILPPGAITSETSGVFFPSRIPMDASLQGTIHSHPSGNPYPSAADLESVFKTKRFHFIAAYPYNLNFFKAFDQRGNEIKFRIV